MRDADRSLSFEEAQALTRQIAVAMANAGFAQQAPAALYSPNSVDVLVTLLGMWRANAKWIPVNTRNAIDANAAYLNYVRCEWLFYHSSLAADVAELKAQGTGAEKLHLPRRTVRGRPRHGRVHRRRGRHPWEDPSDPFGNLDEIVGIFPTGGTTGPVQGGQRHQSRLGDDDRDGRQCDRRAHATRR